MKGLFGRGSSMLAKKILFPEEPSTLKSRDRRDRHVRQVNCGTGWGTGVLKGRRCHPFLSTNLLRPAHPCPRMPIGWSNFRGAPPPRSSPPRQPGSRARPGQARPGQAGPGEPAPPARPARRPPGQPVPYRSPKNALAVNAKGLPMHTSLTRPVHPPVAPVVGRSHNRQLFHHLNPHPPVVEQSHNRRRNTI